MIFYHSGVRFGAPEGTRTHTLKAREPKSRMSTNSITGAYELLEDSMAAFHTAIPAVITAQR